MSEAIGNRGRAYRVPRLAEVQQHLPHVQLYVHLLVLLEYGQFVLDEQRFIPGFGSPDYTGI